VRTCELPLVDVEIAHELSESTIEYGRQLHIISVVEQQLSAIYAPPGDRSDTPRPVVWLTHDSPPFLVMAGARALAVVCIALTFVFINKNNYGFFAIAALVVAACAVLFIARFDRLRKIHTYRVPLLVSNGAHARDSNGNPLFENRVIGTEGTMRPDARKALAQARKEHGPISLTDYLSGSGGKNVNNPGGAWSLEELAKVSNRLTVTLMGIVLTAVLALYLAASVVQVYLP